MRYNLGLLGVFTLVNLLAASTALYANARARARCVRRARRGRRARLESRSVCRLVRVLMPPRSHLSHRRVRVAAPLPLARLLFALECVGLVAATAVGLVDTSLRSTSGSPLEDASSFLAWVHAAILLRWVMTQASPRAVFAPELFRAVIATTAALCYVAAADPAALRLPAVLSLLLKGLSTAAAAPLLVGACSNPTFAAFHATVERSSPPPCPSWLRPARKWCIAAAANAVEAVLQGDLLFDHTSATAVRSLLFPSSCCRPPPLTRALLLLLQVMCIVVFFDIRAGRLTAAEVCRDVVLAALIAGGVSLSLKIPAGSQRALRLMEKRLKHRVGGVGGTGGGGGGRAGSGGGASSSSHDTQQLLPPPHAAGGGGPAGDAHSHAPSPPPPLHPSGFPHSQPHTAASATASRLLSARTERDLLRTAAAELLSRFPLVTALCVATLGEADSSGRRRLVDAEVQAVAGRDRAALVGALPAFIVPGDGTAISFVCAAGAYGRGARAMAQCVARSRVLGFIHENFCLTRVVFCAQL